MAELKQTDEIKQVIGPNSELEAGNPSAQEPADYADADLFDEPPSAFTLWMHKNGNKLIAIFMAIFLVMLAIIGGMVYMEWQKDPYENVILPNIQIGGVDVGEMTCHDALVAVVDSIGCPLVDNDMVINLGAETLTLPAADAKPTVDAQKAVNDAFAYGRDVTREERKQILLELETEGMNIEIRPYLDLDTDYVKYVLTQAAEERNREPIPAGYSLEGEMPALGAREYDEAAPCQTLQLTTGSPGMMLDVESIYAAILDAYSNRSFHVGVSTSVLPEALDLDAVHEALTIAPVEAVQDPESLEVVPGSCGYTFQLEEARAKLESAPLGQTISIPMEYVMPETLDIIMEYPYRLSTYTTTLYDNANYQKNVSLACEALDGFVVEAGKVFSLKEALPKLTEANGFLFAPAHADYCGSETRGGGLDQLASTLHVAAICADTKIIQRHPAHHICEFTEKGTEISIIGTSQDFRFINTWDVPIQIQASVQDGQLKISIFGKEKPEQLCQIRSDSLSTKGFQNIQIRKKSTDGFSNDDVIRNGINGGAVQVYRVYVDRETKEVIKEQQELYAFLQPVDRLVAVVD